jgi:lipopolysaccharide/colanic/teichoic acid biosynthesis glycosyltransferase
MKVLNKIAKIHLKILSFSTLLFMLLVVPAVLAMSVEDVAALHPYGFMAFWLGLSTAIVHYAQSRFRHIKRVFDIVVSIIAITVTLPLVIGSAIFIKLLSPTGKIIYTQTRVGKDGKRFEIYKLRSMKPDAESKTGAVWANEGHDSRVIPFIGGFLRKTHIDEIPQFFNVLKGDMSVVGPRPERPELVAKLTDQVPEYLKRLQVKPGITGLAQIRNRYDKTLRDVKRKVKLDLLYIRKMCLFSEIGILLRTFVVVFRGKVIS